MRSGLAVQPPPRVLVERFHVALEMSDELRTKGAPFLARADGVELEGDAGEAQTPPKPADHGQLLEIDIGAGEPERLDTEGMVLAVASLCGRSCRNSGPLYQRRLGPS